MMGAMGEHGTLASSTERRVDQLMEAARKEGAAALLARAGLSLRLMKELAECMLDAELGHHLSQHPAPGAMPGANHRNGSTLKTVSTPAGRIELAVPRARCSTFVPRLVQRYQRSIPGFDERTLALFGRGMGVHELQARLAELYGARAWADLRGALTDAVFRHTRLWQARQLEASCALVYIDALAPHGQAAGTAPPLYCALAMRADGSMEILGFWIGSAAQARFWHDVMEELRDRGLVEVGSIAGGRLHGLQDAAASVYPAARFRPLRPG